MWALRRASSHSLKTQGLNVSAFRTSAGLGTFSSHVEDKSSGFQSRSFMLDSWISSYTCNSGVAVPYHSLLGSRCLSSQAGVKSGGQIEDDLEEGFSELESPVASESIDEHGYSSITSDSDLSSVDENIEDTLESELMKETDVDAEKKSSKKAAADSALFKLVLGEPTASFSGALDKYVDGKELSRAEAYQTLLDLRRRKLYGKALQLSEWLEQQEDFVFSERDYASRVDLIAKVRGFQHAESYVNNIPIAFRKEVVYRTLLANSVWAANVSKSKEVFDKMKELGLKLTAFTCNQLLLLYKRTDSRKIADVLMLMEEEDVKPSLFTYQILIDTKGQSNDIDGMEQIVEQMKAEGVEPNIRIQATLARHYAAANLNEKAEAVLKEMEGIDLKLSRFVCPILLELYSDLGKTEDVERIWRFVESKPGQAEFFAAIAAFGKLKNIEQAEAVFQKLAKSNVKLTAKHYTSMLKVYSENKMLSKGKELLKQMGDNGCHIGPVAWDALVKLYLEAGEVEKADIVLQKAARQNPQRRPLYSTYLAILDNYSKRGDVHNAEKTFQRMRRAGYVERARPFRVLLQAYINANAPAYGMRERMKADNIFPNKGMATQLSVVDVFKKTPVSNLLD